MDKKVERIINLYNRLNEGEVLNKSDEAVRFDVNEKSIQRDFEDIRAYFANDPGSNRELVYDRTKKGYVLVQNQKHNLTNSEILTVCKILLESRSLVKEEMYPIIDKLLQCCVPLVNYKRVADLIANEKFHYIEPRHLKRFVDEMWNISSAVFEHRLMRIRYQKLKEPDKVMRMIQPVGLMFSEYYFYLNAYIVEQNAGGEYVHKYDYPAIFRIDRIESYKNLKIKFKLPYANRFEEGEFRKRIQFMYPGKLQKVQFKYKGTTPEPVLDRLPTAEVKKLEDDYFLIEAEVYGKGIIMWLLSQGDKVEVIKPAKMREEIKKILTDMLNLYN